MTLTFDAVSTYPPAMTRRISGVIALFLSALLFAGCTTTTGGGGGGNGGGGSSFASGGGRHHHHHHRSAPSYTPAEQSAINAARGYLSMGGTSRAGLIDQLSSKYADHFHHKDAVFAVNHIKANYRNQALMAARGYMSEGGMSRAGLIGQLTSNYADKFTHAQAVYAANKLGLR